MFPGLIFFFPRFCFPVRWLPMKSLNVLVLALLLCGCGRSDLPDLGYVTGKVTVGGTPQPNAVVKFTPVGEGRPSSGETDESGNYELQYLVDTKGAIVGEHVVTVALIQSEEEDNLPEGSEEARTLPPSATDGSIKKEVKAGSQEINIDL